MALVYGDCEDSHPWQSMIFLGCRKNEPECVKPEGDTPERVHSVAPVPGGMWFRSVASSDSRFEPKETVNPRNNPGWRFSRHTEELRHDPLRSACLSKGSEERTRPGRSEAQYSGHEDWRRD